jgi:hypothetical protein
MVSTDSESPIECEIRTFKFGSCPYIALSYVWGDPHFSKEININSLPHLVGRNLHDFLKVACDAGITEWLWIDALCINQSNNAERNHQVGLMDRIYAGASQVIAWLGPEANDSDYIIDQISLANSSDFPAAFRRFTESSLARNHFFLRPFWRRVWIIQELLLAPRVSFMCGHKTVSYDNMSIWIHQMKVEIGKHPTIFTSSTDVIDAMRCVIALFDNRTGNTTLHYDYRLKDTLEAFLLFESSDVRDRVYGLLSLVKLEDKIAVDYSKTAEQVFCDVILKLGSCKDLFQSLENLQSFCWRLNSIWRLKKLYPSIIRDLAYHAFNAGAEPEVLYLVLESWWRVEKSTRKEKVWDHRSQQFLTKKRARPQ